MATDLEPFFNKLGKMHQRMQKRQRAAQSAVEEIHAFRARVRSVIFIFKELSKTSPDGDKIISSMTELHSIVSFTVDFGICIHFRIYELSQMTLMRYAKSTEAQESTQQ